MGLLIFANLNFILTLKFMSAVDLIGWKRMNTVISSDEIEFPFPIKIRTPMMHRTCRHVQQSCTLATFIFSSTNFTYGRVFFLAIMIIGVLIGIYQEECELNKFTNYQEYAKLVPNRFIPNYFNLFNEELIKKLDDIHDKIE